MIYTSASPLTEEQLERYGAGEYLDFSEYEKNIRRAVATARTPGLIEEDLLSIVYEELYAYSGSEHLSVEEVCEIINDRTGKLYSERS